MAKEEEELGGGEMGIDPGLRGGWGSTQGLTKEDSVDFSGNALVCILVYKFYIQRKSIYEARRFGNEFSKIPPVKIS